MLDDSWMEFQNKTVNEYTNELYILSGNFQYPPEKSLLGNISNVSLNWFYERENWVSDYVDIDWVKNRFQKKYDSDTEDSAKITDELKTGIFTPHGSVE